MCVQGCSDKIREKLGPDAKDDELNKYQGEFDKCVVKCADQHIETLAEISKNIQDKIRELT